MAGRNTNASPSMNEKPKTGLAANPHNPSSAAYLAYPVKHVVSSLYRRMTEPPDQPVSKLLDAPDPPAASHSGLYTPPQRSASPYQPPPLSPLQLSHTLSTSQAESLLLTRSLAEEIRLLIPPRLQLLDSWRLAYSLEVHGSSLGTLYQHCETVTGALGSTQRGGYILLISDGSDAATNGSSFGAYLTDAPRPSQHYYGTGECFLWRASILPSLSTITAQALAGRTRGDKSPPSEDLLELAGLPPPPSADTTNAQRTTTVKGERRRSSAANSPTSPRRGAPVPFNGNKGLRPPSPVPSGVSTPDRIRFKAFPYSGVNDFMIYCESGYLSVGGGDGHYGLWLDDQLETGISESCPTFGNEPLSDEGKKFDVLGVEIWYVGA